MPNLASHARLAEDTRFRDRVRAAFVQAAVNVSGEAEAPDARSAARQAFALAVLMGTVPVAVLAWAIASNSAILATYTASDRDQSAIPDGDIEYTASTVWDDLSGAASLAASE